MFLFLNREATQVKILMWTRGGFTIVHKRLEQGRFQFVKSVQEGVGHVEIDVHEVSMLLEGLDLSALKGANRWSPQPLKAAS
jgi:transposase